MRFTAEATLILHPDDPFRLTDETRSLGLVVCRGTGVIVVSPQDGIESIPNPFIQHND